jgi:chromosome segregation ATPase
MVHTRFSTPDTAIGDPVVEIHESQLKGLRARANLAVPSAIIGVVALTLIVAGIVRVERSIREFNLLAEARGRAVADQVRALSDQLAARTDAKAISRIAVEANAAPIAGASKTAQQALTTARAASASIVPVAEQLATADGQMVQMRADLANLSGQGSKQAAQLAEVSQDLTSLRAAQDRQVGSLNDRLASQGSRLDLIDQDARATKSWTRAAAAGAAMGIGITAAHVLSHAGR